jgi:glyoxylase I family protein
MRFEHTAYNVSEPAAQAQWYVEAFGLRIVRSIGAPTFTHFVTDAENRLTLEFYNNERGPIPDYRAINQWTQHIAFSSADLRADALKLSGLGATWDGEVVDLPGGDQTTFVRDPWGLTVQLIQRVKPLY